MTITQNLVNTIKHISFSVIIFFGVHAGWAQPRIVALSPAINEIIFALGAGKHVVANTLYSNYPPESRTLYKVGGYFQPSLERIIAIQPTLVILHPLDPGFIARLTALDIKTVTVNMRSLNDIIQAIETIGQVTHKSEAATRLTQKLKDRISATQLAPRDVKMLVVFGMSLNFDSGVYVAGHKIYFNDIIQLIGCKNAFESPTIAQPILTQEGILAAQPDMVIILAPDRLAHDISRQAVKKPWQQLAIPAARHQHIYVIDASYATLPSHRVIHLIDDFKAIVQKFH